VAESDSVSVYLAKNRAASGNFGDAGGLPQPHLPDALAKLTFAGELANQADGPRRKLAEGKQDRVGVTERRHKRIETRFQ
jgi:hypothetical protein